MEEVRTNLDPVDWAEVRVLGHRMVDDMIDHVAQVAGGPVWRPMPGGVRGVFAAGLPVGGRGLAEVYEEFGANILPYGVGNLHPRFMGWVHGGGTVVSVLAELLAAGMNVNCGGRDHVGLAVERQVVGWAAAMFGLPVGTGGVLLTGSSMANFVAVLCARYRVLGDAGRLAGVGGRRLVAYAAVGVHRCVVGALDMAGLGRGSLRLVPVGGDYRMDVAALRGMIEADRVAGLEPFMVVGTAGSVDVGATDDLSAIADICEGAGLWFHVDGAFGALGCLSERVRPRLRGIERADSVAFDFHKWMQVTYDAGCVLVRDAVLQEAVFGQETGYLAGGGGLAGGQPWPCDLGPDLSRGFRALKVWMTLQVYGVAAFGRVVDRACAVAVHLGGLVAASGVLELAAPVLLNIVCFRVVGFSDARLAALVVGLQEAGGFAPSTTVVGGRLVVRAAIVNHRTDYADVEALVGEVERLVNSGEV